MMLYKVGVEDMERDHWVAWAFDKPGLTGRGITRDAAVAQLQSRLSDGEVEVVEEFRLFRSAEDPDYEVNAFFEDDRHPLTKMEVDTALDELTESRRVFLAQLEGVPPELLTQPIPGEKFGSISGIVRHVGGAEWWYCHQLGGDPAWENFPDDGFAAIALSRDYTRAFLPTLVGDTRVVTRTDEIWSPRKVLRRTLWHERDHTEHIAQRLRQLGWD